MYCRPQVGATRAGYTSTRVLGLVPLWQNPSRLVVRHMSSQESPEVLTNFLPMIPYLDISAIQLLCRDKEVASLGASHVAAMELARDAFGLWLGLED